MASHIIRFQEKPSALFKLFCFPYAGSGAAVYRPWGNLLPPEVELYAIDLPGRVHLKEKCPANMQELIDVLYPEMLPLLKGRFAFFGHSYGSAVAYEILKRLQQEGKPLPEHLFISARRAPHITTDTPRTSHLPDDAFLEAIQVQYGAIPGAILKDKALLALFLPILKEDIKINESYVGTINPPLTIPVTAYHGVEDKSGTIAFIGSWKEVTTGPFTLQTFPGGHFYIDTARESLVKDIIKKI